MFTLGFFVPFYYVIDHAISAGVEAETSAYLLSIIGVVNIVARILCGFLADTSCGDPLKIYSGALILGGAATMGASWLQSFQLLAGYAVVFGFCVGNLQVDSQIVLQHTSKQMVYMFSLV